MEAEIQAILEKYSDYLGHDEQDGVAINGISMERFPALAFELAMLVEPDKVIADNMQDYWKHQRCGAE